MQITPIYQLDKVLEFFVFHNHDLRLENMIKLRAIVKSLAYNKTINMFPELDTVDFKDNYDLIIDKLVNDKFLNELPEDELFGKELPKRYYITFDGKLFSENGGYTTERLILGVPLQQQKKLNFLTAVLSVATAALVLIELAKLWIEHNPFYCY